MEANELRIGNIGIFDGKYAQVLEIREDALKLFVKDVGIFEDPNGVTFESVPLTEKWLEWFGFEKDDDGVWDHDQSMWSCEISGDDDSFNFKKLGLDILCPDVLYVHQLQNLFFAMEQSKMNNESLQ
jgi:hypothetical protein